MINLFKKRNCQQREKALEWFREWEKNHPEAVQEFEEQEQKINYLKENNIPLDSLTNEELDYLSTSFSDVGEQAMEILQERLKVKS